MMYEKFRLEERKSIKKFCKDRGVNFVQWVSGGEGEIGRIYLCKTKPSGRVRNDRLAKIYFRHNTLGEAIKILEEIVKEMEGK